MVDSDQHQLVELGLADGPNDVDLGDVVLAAGLTLEGRVTGSDGRPAREAWVSAEPMDGAGWDRSAETGRDGRFVVDGLPDVPLMLEVEGSRGDDRERVLRCTDVRPGGPPLQLAFTRGLHVRFRLLLRRDRTWVSAPHVRVDVHGPGDTDSASCRHRYAAPGIRQVVLRIESPGAYRAIVDVTGYDRVTVDRFEIVEDRDTLVDVLLEPSGPEEG